MRPLALVASLAVVLSAPTAASAVQYLEDRIGPGTVYGIWVPDAWNGDLVLYAHGFRNPNCPLAVPTTPAAICLGGDSGTPQAVRPMRDALLAMGYAFAASSYSDAGLALMEGSQQTFQLKKIFGARVAPPRRTYLYGHSMGGAIVLELAERHPGEFDGALAMCGMVGGSPAQFRYVADARATFDFLFPGLAPGGVAAVPPGLTFYGDVAPAVLAQFHAANPAMVDNLRRAAAWASIDQVSFPAATPQELVKGILEVLYFHALGTPGVVAAANGTPTDNRGVTYEDRDPSGSPVFIPPLPIDFAALNAGVERVAPDPEALAFADHHYDTTGELAIPVITLHTAADAAVPLVHERIYRAKVEAAGRSDLLVQRTVRHDPRTDPPDGHCTFTLAEELTAFSDLVQWLETGRRPAGDASP